MSCRILVLILLLFSALDLLGQKYGGAVFEDKDGKSSILLPTMYLGTNLSDESLEARFFYYNKSPYTSNKVVDYENLDYPPEPDSDSWKEVKKEYYAELPKGFKTDTTYIDLVWSPVKDSSILPREIKSYIHDSVVVLYTKYDHINKYVFKEKTTLKTIIKEELYKRNSTHLPFELITVQNKVEEKTKTKYSKYNYKRKNNEKLSLEHSLDTLLVNDSVMILIKKTVRKYYESKIPDFRKNADGSVKTDMNGDTTFKKDMIYKKSSARFVCKNVERHVKAVTNSLFGGFTIRSKATNGVSSIFDESEFTVGTSFDLHIGLKNLIFREFKVKSKEPPRKYEKKDGKFRQDWLTLTGGLATNKFRIIDISQPFSDQVSTKRFRGYNWNLSYNVFYNNNLLVGVSGSIQQSNNAGDLTTTKFKEVISSSASDSTRTIESEGEGLLGSYKTFIEYNLNFDVIYYLPSYKFETTFAFNPYYRTIAFSNKLPITNAGLGLYVLRPSNSKVIFGTLFEYNDIYNVNNDDDQDIDRLSIGLTVKRLFGVKRPEKL